MPTLEERMEALALQLQKVLQDNLRLEREAVLEVERGEVQAVGLARAQAQGGPPLPHAGREVGVAAGRRGFGGGGFRRLLRRRFDARGRGGLLHDDHFGRLGRRRGSGDRRRRRRGGGDGSGGSGLAAMA